MSVTWFDVREKTDRIAAGLISLGLKPNDPVAILGNTRLEWTLSDLGALSAGCCSLGIYQTLPASQVVHIPKDSGARLLFVENHDQVEKILPHAEELVDLDLIVMWDNDGRSYPEFEVIPFESLVKLGRKYLEANTQVLRTTQRKIHPDNTAIIVYTSGTTGPPKGACLSHKNILSQLKAIQAICYEEDLGDTMMFYLPLCHVGERIAGQYMRIHRGLAGAYVKDIKLILEDTADIKPTVFGSVPRVFEKAYARIQSEVKNSSPLKQWIFRWAESIGRDVSRHIQDGRHQPAALKMKHKIADKLVFNKVRELFGGRTRYFLTSSAPISIEILEFFHACGMLIMEGYGQTEISCFCTLCSPTEYRFGSVGKPIPGVEVKIAQDGEIMVRGEIVFKGYLNQPEQTANTVTKGGWIHTGDLGRFDSAGYLYVTGRKKEIIVTSGGKNVTPSNIEGFLTDHPLIELAMVHGDRRKYLTAIFSLSEEDLAVWADKRNLNGMDYGTLIKDEVLLKELRSAVDEVNSKLARFETIKKFTIAPQPFSVETGELTPTLKVKRKVVEKKYMDMFDTLYF